MSNYDEQLDVTETIQTVIKFSYDMLKENDGLIHKRSIIQKLCEAELYYDPPYIFEIFDSVDESKNEILTLEEFTNFYHIINQKGDYVKQHNKNNTCNDYDFSDIAIGFVVVGITAAGALFFANKLKR